MAEQIDIINLLKDKTSLVEYLYNMIMSSEKFSVNLPQMREKGWSEKGMLDKVVEISAIQSQQIKHLALICILVVQSKDFDKMVAELMMSMGRGKEALRAMMEARFKNKY